MAETSHRRRAGPVFQCEFCSAPFNTAKGFRRHLIVHHGHTYTARDGVTPIPAADLAARQAAVRASQSHPARTRSSATRQSRPTVSRRRRPRSSSSSSSSVSPVPPVQPAPAGTPPASAVVPVPSAPLGLPPVPSTVSVPSSVQASLGPPPVPSAPLGLLPVPSPVSAASSVLASLSSYHIQSPMLYSAMTLADAADISEDCAIDLSTPPLGSSTPVWRSLDTPDLVSFRAALPEIDSVSAADATSVLPDFTIEDAVQAVLGHPERWPHQLAADLLATGRPSFPAHHLPVLLVGVRLGIAAAVRELSRGSDGVRALRPFVGSRPNADAPPN